MSDKSLKQTGNFQGRKAGGCYASVQRGSRALAAGARRTFLKRDAAKEVSDETEKMYMFGQPGFGEWKPLPKGMFAEKHCIIIDYDDIVS